MKEKRLNYCSWNLISKVQWRLANLEKAHYIFRWLFLIPAPTKFSFIKVCTSFSNSILPVNLFKNLTAIKPDFNFSSSSTFDFGSTSQRWSRGHKARGQGQGRKKNPRPRPRTAFPRTDTLEAKDRNARGQGQGPVADLGGGMGGCIPPTSLKVTILAEKSASISNNSAPVRDASPPPA